MIEANARLIRIRMAELDINRQELAELAGITQPTLRRILNGGDCMLTTLTSISLVLGINPDEMLIRNGEVGNGERMAA